MPFELLVLALLVEAPASPPPDVVERIVAVVDDRPVLLSEARLVARLKGLDLDPAVDAVVEEILMYREASRLPQATVSAPEEEKAVRRLEEQAPDAPALDLKRLAKRQVTILNYIEFRFRPEVRVTDDDVARAYRQRFPGPAKGPSYEEAAPQLRAELAERSLSQRIEAWVKDLRSAAQIRYNRPPGTTVE